MKVFNKAAAVSSVMFAITIFGGSVVYAADVIFTGTMPGTCELGGVMNGTLAVDGGALNSDVTGGTSGSLDITSNGDVSVTTSVSLTTGTAGTPVATLSASSFSGAQENTSITVDLLIPAGIGTSLAPGSYAATVTVTCMPNPA